MSGKVDKKKDLEEMNLKDLLSQEEDSHVATQEGNSKVSPDEEERQMSGQEDKEEKEIKGALNLRDLFSEEEDSLDDTQEENSRLALSKEERQTSGQEDKEEREIKGPLNLPDLFSKEEDSLDDTQKENSRVGPSEEECQMSRQVDKEEMDLGEIENSTLEVGQTAEKPKECIKEAPLHLMEVQGEPFRKGTRKMIAENLKHQKEMDGEYVKNMRKRIAKKRKFSLDSMQTMNEGRTKKRFGRYKRNSSSYVSYVIEAEEEATSLLDS
ncbi:myb-like protein X [Palaemon carinicauda]|uniref:myb-like protein X n=1 Tax=Palaemon carinicauda TaxID=392227 RepID=UPI0035B64C3A